MYDFQPDPHPQVSGSGKPLSVAAGAALRPLRSWNGACSALLLLEWSEGSELGCESPIALNQIWHLTRKLIKYHCYNGIHPDGVEIWLEIAWASQDAAALGGRAAAKLAPSKASIECRWGIAKKANEKTGIQVYDVPQAVARLFF